MQKLITHLALATSLVIGKAAAEGIPVYDAKTVIQTTISALNSVEQVTQQIKMVANQAKQLRTLDVQVMSALDESLDGQLSAVVGLLDDLKAMKYDWQNSKREFDSIFGKEGSSAAKNPAQYATFLERIGDQIRGAARTATQAQQVLTKVEKYNRANQQALGAATEADGDVRQLQAANLQLSNINAQLGDLAQLTATAARLQATQAAADQAKLEADRAAVDRMTSPSNIILSNPARSKQY